MTAREREDLIEFAIGKLTERLIEQEFEDKIKKKTMKLQFIVNPASKTGRGIEISASRNCFGLKCRNELVHLYWS